MPIRENHGSRVPRTVWAHFRFFGGLKTPFLPSCVTHGSRDRSFLWNHFRHLGATKSYSGRVSYDSNLPCFLWDHKCFFKRVAENTVQGYLDSCDLIFYNLASWKSDFWQIVKSTIKWYVASRELIFGILGAWKRLFCEVVKTTVQGYQQVIFCIWGSKYVA